jgi:OOP family OmpA-OmpF porin
MNQGISQQRANAVKSFLEKAGVGAGILTAKGYGPDKPIASNDTPEGQFKNRRIEFIAGK